ncbi:Probable serine/threonine-protein kinase SIS8 [Linum perenne]
MKSLFKKLHITTNQQQLSTTASPEGSASKSSHDHKPLSGISNWLSTVKTSSMKSLSPSNSSRMKQSDSVSSSCGGTPRSAEIDEEYQVKMALELSAIEDPEAAQIEAVKQISLGSSDPANTPAEVLAYRYWNYNALSYDDKIVDGFYDLYGIPTNPQSDRMPSLIELQGTLVSDSITWEAVLVDRATDVNLQKLEYKAREIASKMRSESVVLVEGNLVKKLADLVCNYMGGSVGDPENMSIAWRRLSYSLKATLGSMVLPLGSLTIGLARHRALMFKVLADGVGIPSRLVKGHQFTGSDDVVINFVKLDDGREYIIDLMADPGTLIPSDAAGLHVERDDLSVSASPLSRDIDSSHLASSSSGVASASGETSTSETQERRSEVGTSNQCDAKSEVDEESRSSPDVKRPQKEISGRQNYSHGHARSPSWTEGISSPAAHKKKVKDVSKYMINAAKENPQLAQKLHDVLLESGVVAPPSLFTEFEQLSLPSTEIKLTGIHRTKDKDGSSHARFLPPLPHKVQSKETSPQSMLSSPETISPMEDEPNPARFLPPLHRCKLHSKATSPQGQLEPLKFAEGFGSDSREATPMNCKKNVPVAAAVAAVVASSMVVAAAARPNTDSSLELPIAAAAAAIVASSAAVDNIQGSRDRGSGAQEHDVIVVNSEGERTSDRSTGNDSCRSDVTLDDVAECEIPWEDITMGERIGLGSYGEVYRGEWHGTEVAVKRFLDQDISGESLMEFKSEVEIMKRVRHPNVVLFMGAVTRAPNLSIVSEFLPRGSLYRLLHRPNNQLDERRRLRMALDAARGMNYLHNCSPVIVHRDLKSPNLLVDRNWVVKVCDFGLSRMKHSTFLSSRSTAGTAEWMAPEVLRNEPSDEKCDVYSYGVILWELCTMQQPWGGMNPMQVVGAVGFQHRRLDIPSDMDPAVADIIQKCWQTDPKLRPTFAEIMAALKPLQKPITSSSQAQRHARNAARKGPSSEDASKDQAG